MKGVDASKLTELLEMTDGDANCVREIIAEYLDSGPVYLRKLLRAVDVRDANALKQAAHSFKSSSRYVGAIGLANDLAAIEASAIAENIAEAVSLVEVVRDAYPAVDASLRDWLAKADCGK